MSTSPDAHVIFENAMDIWTALTAVNFLASVLTLVLLYIIEKKNSYMSVISAMTIAQGVFDASLFLFVNSDKYSQNIQLFLGVAAGTAAAMWSLVICLVMTYVVTSRRYFDLSKQLTKLHFWINGYCLSFGISMVITHIMAKANNGNDKNSEEAFKVLLDLFNIVRIAIIVVTVGAIMIMVVSLSKMRVQSDNSVWVLAKRMVLYPTVQLISRLPITIFQLFYQIPLREFEFAKNVTPSMHFWFIFSVILTPAAGAGNLCAFLIIQPQAYGALKKLLVNIGLCSSNQLGIDMDMDPNTAKCKTITDSYRQSNPSICTNTASMSKIDRKNDYTQEHNHIEKDKMTSTSKNFIKSTHHTNMVDNSDISREGSLYDIDIPSQYESDGCDGSIRGSSIGSFRQTDELDKKGKMFNRMINFDDYDEEELVRHIADQQVHRESLSTLAIANAISNNWKESKEGPEGGSVKSPVLEMARSNVAAETGRREGLTKSTAVEV